jgi:hypothetical protein
MLVHDHRTHPNSQIDLDKPDLPLAFARTSSSNTGSIILHVAHVAGVDLAIMARCEPRKLRNDVGFVDRGMVVVVVGLLPRALVEVGRWVCGASRDGCRRRQRRAGPWLMAALLAG